MFFDILIYTMLTVVILVVVIDGSLDVLRLFQIGTYDATAIFNYMSFNAKRGLGYWCLYAIILLCYIFLNIEEKFILFLVLVIIGALLILFGNKFKNVKDIVYTKRMLRLICLSIIIGIIECVLFVMYLPFTYSTILTPIFMVLVYFNVYISYILLKPIEYLIGVYYISKAKKKFSLNKRLIKIGITGSFGKTSVKEILTSILKESFVTLSTPKSYNTPFGITKTINTKLDASDEVFVCELGAKKRGEIKYLCNLFDFDIGIVTSVGRQHLKTFGSLENIYRTKKELPDALYGKVCVFNLMNIYVARMYHEFVGKKIGVFVSGCSNIVLKHKLLKCFYYCKKPCSLKNDTRYYLYPKKSNYYAKRIKCTESGCEFDICYDGNFLLHTSTKLIGLHNVINILLGIALARELGESINNISLGLSKIEKIKARLEKINLDNGAIVINNGYNSNIDSAKYTLDILNVFKRANRVVITPGIVETDDDYKYNFELGQMVGRVATSVIIVKETNKNALLDGLLDIGYDMCNVKCVSSIFDAKKEIEMGNENYVFLIENDLPDNYR